MEITTVFYTAMNHSQKVKNDYVILEHPSANQTAENYTVGSIFLLSGTFGFLAKWIFFHLGSQNAKNQKPKTKSPAKPK